MQTWHQKLIGKQTQLTTILFSGRVGKAEMGGFRVNFTFDPNQTLANFTSTLLVTNIHLNETDVTCEGRIAVDVNNRGTTTICYRVCSVFALKPRFTVGPASSPTTCHWWQSVMSHTAI